MERQIFKILSNVKLTDNVYKTVLEGNTDKITASGQFVNILIDGLFLRRPVSVCDYSENTLTLVYKVVGKGTKKLSEMNSGYLDILVGLGNGYDLSKSGEKPLLIGGGVGVPPLYNLCKKLRKTGKEVSVILGFNTKSEIFFEKEFKLLGAETFVSTVDGSYGERDS